MQQLFAQYLDIIKKVRVDLRRPAYQNIYALDFSELHGYLHRWKHSPSDFIVINYITENIDTPKDQLSLLPPTVVELLTYLDNLSARLSRYRHYQRLLQDRRIDAFLKSAEQLDKGSEPGEILNVRSVMQATDVVRRFASGLGSPLLIREPVQKFISLVDSQRIKSVQRILGTSEVPLDRKAYEVFRTGLEEKRPLRTRNNVIDALCGGMVFGICRDMYELQRYYSNFITESKYPLEVMQNLSWEKDPMRSYGKTPLVRSTMYLLSRTIWKDLLLADPDRLQALSRSIPTLEKLVTFNDEHAMYDFLSRTITERYADRPDFQANEFKDLHFFVKVFYYDSNWDEIYRRAKLKLMENSFARRELIDALDRGDEQRLERLSEGSYDQIKSMEGALLELRGYENGLRKSQEELRETMTKVYVNLKQFLEGLDLSLISPDAQALIERIEKEH